MNPWVVEAARGRGLGRALFGACTAAAEEEGMHRILLRATPMGRPLDERSGFVTNPERRPSAGP